MNVWLSQHLLHGLSLDECLVEVSLQTKFRYEEERVPRVKTVYEKGKSAASAEDKEKYLYKPTFKPLWQKKVCHIVRGLFGVPCYDMTALWLPAETQLSEPTFNHVCCKQGSGKHRHACGGLMVQKHPAASEKHTGIGSACWQLALWICCPF